VACAPETTSGAGSGVLARRGKRLEGRAAARSPVGKRPALFHADLDRGVPQRALADARLDYDGEPIARRCAFLAGDGSFASRRVDEPIGHYSPGTILEIDSLLQLQGLRRVRWMDSCGRPDNALINRISNRTQGDSYSPSPAVRSGEAVISGCGCCADEPAAAGGAVQDDIPSTLARESHDTPSTCLEIDADTFRSHFNRRPFLFRHIPVGASAVSAATPHGAGENAGRQLVEFNAGQIPGVCRIGRIRRTPVFRAKTRSARRRDLLVDAWPKRAEHLYLDITCPVLDAARTSGPHLSEHASRPGLNAANSVSSLQPTIPEQISSALRIVSSPTRPVYGVSCNSADSPDLAGVEFDKAAVQRFRQLREAWQLKQRMPRQVVAEQEGPAVEVAAEGVRIDFETSAGVSMGFTATSMECRLNRAAAAAGSSSATAAARRSRLSERTAGDGEAMNRLAFVGDRLMRALSGAAQESIQRTAAAPCSCSRLSISRMVPGE